MTPFHDAHNHLQDPRLAPFLDEVVEEMTAAGVACCVVNGTCEEDWPRVADLAERFPELVRPSFGLHPWKIAERSPRWAESLQEFLERFPAAGVGECGLDRWKKPFDLAAQRAVFLAQIDLAARFQRPLSVHCLQAWGPLQECLASSALPSCGFLLHSYGGSRELVPVFAKLGAFFSFSGHFLHPRKEAARKAFQEVPLDRLLLETDAPDMLPPDEFRRRELTGAEGEVLNHPANLPRFVPGLATMRGLGSPAMASQLAINFPRLFS